MTDKQPEALRLAKLFEACPSVFGGSGRQAAAELRRLHEVNTELVEALERIAGFTYSQFADSKDMAIECVMVACKALAKAQGENNAQ